MEVLKTYEEARAYISNISKTGSILGLTSIQNLMKELGDVQDRLPILHIAGTNGKGSTGTFLASILQEAGYKVGRYTSPAVFSPLEVWRINGEIISIEDYITTLSQVKNACDIMVSKGMPHPTVFEVETAMAFLYFYQKKCDYVLLETGMGGREDATNLIQKPVCSILTTISMDHMKFLGDTLEKIAWEKAGIIKEGCPVFLAAQKESVQTVVQSVANQKHAPLTIADIVMVTDENVQADGLSFTDEVLGKVTLQMSGTYQLFNAKLAIAVANFLLEKQEQKEAMIRKGLEKAHWPGRFETILKEPLFIIDGAHNEDAALQLRKTLENCFTNRRITYIIGVLADKEHEKMLKTMLPLAEQVFTVTPQNDRALAGETLAKEAQKYHPKVRAAANVKEAVEQAIALSGPEDVILAFGSLSYLSEVKAAV